MLWLLIDVLARFGSPATACVDRAEDLSPQSSPFRDAWIGKTFVINELATGCCSHHPLQSPIVKALFYKAFRFWFCF